MNDKVIIIGGGIIGLSLGWQLAKKGKEVSILERGKAGVGASYTAAGMLAPQAEMGFEDIEMFNLCRKSLAMYPAFTEELFQTLSKHFHQPFWSNLFVFICCRNLQNCIIYLSC